MTLKTLKELLALPALIIGALLAMGSFLGFFGTDLVTQEDRLQNHVETELQWHRADSLSTGAFRSEAESKLKELDQHAEVTQDLIESLVRGECLEKARTDLMRQGLILKCRSLGIEPSDSGR